MREATTATGDSLPAPSAQPTRLPPGARLALSLGSLAVIALVGGRWLLHVYDAFHTIAGRYDFSTYYAAAYALRLDPHANIYNPVVLVRAGAAAHVLVQPPLAYTYPPLFAILLSPFTLFSFQVLSRLWLAFNAALWLAVTLLLARELSIFVGSVGRSGTPMQAGAQPVALISRARRLLRDNPGPLLALALSVWLCLTSAPADQTLVTGQINFLVLLPLVLVLPLTRRGHERWTGVMIALAAILKFTPALLILYLVLRRRWQAALAAVGTLAALTALSALVVGPSVTLAAIPQALHVGTGDAALGHNEALLGPLYRALGQGPGEPGLLLYGVLAVMLVLIWLWLGIAIWRAARPGPNATSGTQYLLHLVPYAIALCGLLLLAPTAWVHHYVWVLPAAAIALGWAAGTVFVTLGTPALRTSFASLALVVLACVLLNWGQPYDWDTNPHPTQTHFLGLPLWPGLLLLRGLAAGLLFMYLTFFDLRVRRSQAIARQRDHRRPHGAEATRK
ncbi:MAG TPA: glycosyltransferase family 87 protein [Ktedonobacterales bacterium]|nr:glycosyltransferase family 87 protein [Ktedonobacterales bacterium]